MIYLATKHLLARIYFDSDIQETTKKRAHLSDFSSFSPLHEETLPTTLTYIYIANFLIRENDVALSYVMEMKTDVSKRIKVTSR